MQVTGQALWLCLGVLAWRKVQAGAVFHCGWLATGFIPSPPSKWEAWLSMLCFLELGPGWYRQFFILGFVQCIFTYITTRHLLSLALVQVVWDMHSCSSWCLWRNYCWSVLFSFNLALAPDQWVLMQDFEKFPNAVSTIWVIFSPLHSVTKEKHSFVECRIKNVHYYSKVY